MNKKEDKHLNTMRKILQMKLSLVLYIFFMINTYGQIVINLGPFKSYFPDPLAKSQEKRATSVDRQMIPKVTAMAIETQAVRKFVNDYKNSLSTINPALQLTRSEANRFLNDCIDYIVAKNSVVGTIPGLSKLATKMRLISLFETNKIRSLKTELTKLFHVNNYMTEGERKLLLLDIIDRALQITI